MRRAAAGDWVFRELNSSPVYLDVERKLGHPISRAIAELVVGQRPFVRSGAPRVRRAAPVPETCGRLVAVTALRFWRSP